MTKKVVKKKAATKKIVHSTRSKDKRLEKVLIENFVSMQKVLVNLTEKFDNLAGQISSLLDLFEESAKTLAKGGFEQKNSSHDKQIIEKMDKLFDQNKVLARGLTLIHESKTDSPTRLDNNSEPKKTFSIEDKRV